MNRYYQPTRHQIATASVNLTARSTSMLLFYIVVMALLILQAVYTVYHGGLTVGNGFRLAQLEKQKTQLEASKIALNQSIAQHQSVLQIQHTEAYKQFKPMTGVITVTDTQTMASR